MTDKLSMQAIMWAEVDPDVYAGDNLNEIKTDGGLPLTVI